MGTSLVGRVIVLKSVAILQCHTWSRPCQHWCMSF